MNNRILSRVRLRQHDIEIALLKQARKEDNIVFGGQAIKKKLGILARRTKDFDFFSRTPMKSAVRAQANLDRVFRRDLFFAKKGSNISTWKTKFVGRDLKKGTADDVGIADFTKTPKPVPNTFKFRGVKFRTLKEELKAKERLVRTKGFEFRRAKDLEDLRRIKKFGRIR